MRLAGHVAHRGEMINAYKIVIGKHGEKRPLGSHGRRWEDNIRMDLREIESEFVDWMRLAQDKDQSRTVVNTVMNPRIP
jgi:hypothetical protein